MEANEAACELKADPQLFARVSRLVATSESLDRILQTILDEAVWVSDSVRGFLAIIDFERGELDVRYVSGEGWDESKRITRLRVTEDTGKGITSHVAATARPYRSPDVDTDPFYLPYFSDVKSELAVPLVDSFQRVRGVINVESVNPDAYGFSHECTLSGLADLATIAMNVASHRSRNAALMQVARELHQLNDTEIILQKVIGMVATALRFEDCSLFLVDDATGKLVLRASGGKLRKKIAQAAYDMGEGMTGWVAQHDRPVRVVDPTIDPRWKGRHEEIPSEDVGAFMAAPIHSHRGVIGVIRVQRRKSPYKWFPNAFNDLDENMLVSIAGQIGVALDNSRLVDQLVKAERMAAWGEMSARSAHMIGNRVFAIKGDINELEYYLQQAKVDSKEALKLSDSIKNGIYLLEEILTEFREFVKSTQLDIEEVDINKLVKESISEGFPKRSKTRVETTFAQNLPTIRADAKKLKRCFTELMENAVNFQPEGGQITVSTGVAEPEAKKWVSPSRRRNKFVMVGFQDNGPGIDAADKAKIFRPFFTSRAKGMGLGLSIVKGTIDAHGGVIYEDGKAGQGARFTILLPYDPPTAKHTEETE